MTRKKQCEEQCEEHEGAPSADTELTTKITPCNQPLRTHHDLRRWQRKESSITSIQSMRQMQRAGHAQIRRTAEMAKYGSWLLSPDEEVCGKPCGLTRHVIAWWHVPHLIIG